MRLSGLHLLLTYQCTLECDHCFVWGSPRQSGTMSLQNIREILRQANELGTIEWIYFEGGEPFLFYAVLRRGIELAAAAGFQVGIVSNGYWATTVEDAVEYLSPLAGRVQDLSISSDLYHSDEELSAQARHAAAAARQLSIPCELISIAQPDAAHIAGTLGQLPTGESAVRFRGRAVEKLAAQAPQTPSSQFTECPFEDLREPKRVHLDPHGNVHICQGISLGNIYETPLGEICESYDPASHPITGPLLEGGPAKLARHHAFPAAEGYADACHFCCNVRSAIRERYPDILAPAQMYGVVV